jgi:hypothetical protein
MKTSLKYSQAAGRPKTGCGGARCPLYPAYIPSWKNIQPAIASPSAPGIDVFLQMCHGAHPKTAESAQATQNADRIARLRMLQKRSTHGFPIVFYVFV